MTRARSSSLSRYYNVTVTLGAMVYPDEEGVYPTGQALIEEVEEQIEEGLFQEGLGLKEEELVLVEEEFEEGIALHDTTRKEAP